jgi:hypothetical protein
MPDAKRKRVSHGQEEAQAKTEANVQVLSPQWRQGIAVHNSDGLNSYELARLVDMIRTACKEYRMRGVVTLTIDGKAIP